MGILDADIYGDSIPAAAVAVDELIVPPVKDGLKLMSVGFFLNDNEPVTWRGPMLHKALEQFLTRPIVASHPDSQTAQTIDAIAETIAAQREAGQILKPLPLVS